MGTRRQQQIRILEELEANGWRRDSIERQCDWWADEIWALRSDSAPVGAKAWIAFMVDPGWKGSRASGEGVVSIAADIVRRKERTGWMFEVPLGRRWERWLVDLIEALQGARLAKSPEASRATKPASPKSEPTGTVKTRYKHLR